MTRTVLALLLLLSSGIAAANTASQPIPGNPDYHERYLERAQQGDIDILFIGDSITEYWEDPTRGKSVWDREFAPQNAACFGVNSERLQHIIWRMQNGELDGISPRVVIVLAGTNNIRRNSTGEILEGFTLLLETLRERLPDSKILLLAILPRNEPGSARRRQVAEVNQSLEQMVATDDQIVFLDIGQSFLDADGSIPASLMPDHLHPSTRGYEVFAEAILPTLQTMMPGRTEVPDAVAKASR